jgi:hypothetical protein
MTYVSVDIDLDDIISGLSDKEKQDLIDDLYEDGYYQMELQNQLDEDDNPTISLNEQMFRAEISKIKGNYLNLSNSELEILSAIAKRF